MTLKSFFILSLFAGFAMMPGAQAQDANINYLTLEDVIYLAHQQSPDALIAKHSFKASYWQFKTFKADYLPGVVLNGTTPSYDRSIGQVQQPDGSYEFKPIDQASADLELSLYQEIGPTGGRISLNSGLLWYDNLTGNGVNQPFRANIVNVEYVQPIFRYNDFKWARDIEPMKYEMAKRKYLEDVEQVSIVATNYFFNMMQAQIDMQISVKNMSNYDTLYHIAKGRYQLGKIAENELLQLELNFLKAEAEVQQAELEF